MTRRASLTATPAEVARAEAHLSTALQAMRGQRLPAGAVLVALAFTLRRRAARMVAAGLPEAAVRERLAALLTLDRLDGADAGEEVVDGEQEAAEPVAANPFGAPLTPDALADDERFSGIMTPGELASLLGRK